MNVKRLKHKEKNKHPPIIICSVCNIVDVAKDDGELECICVNCWKKIDHKRKESK